MIGSNSLIRWRVDVITKIGIVVVDPNTGYLNYTGIRLKKGLQFFSSFMEKKKMTLIYIRYSNCLERAAQRESARVRTATPYSAL